jgi:DNA-directed RNA polymerase specialized sigma24 family protein
LLEWLDDGVDSQGEKYLEMRRRLVAYFDRRDRLAADELADETLNRVGRTLERTGAVAINPPARYCYVIARFVLLEDIRRGRRHVGLDEPRIQPALQTPATAIVDDDDEFAIREQRLERLECCLRALRPDQHELVIEYYREARRQRIERRRELANRLGITMNALSIRVCRIRDALMACMDGAERLRAGSSYRRGLTSPHRSEHIGGRL